MEGTTGEIRLFGGNFAPLYWAFCDGSLMNIAENTALYSLLGTTYGGDGNQTFALPDFRGRVAVGTDLAGRYPLGMASGSESATMNMLNMPAHTHASSSIIQVPASNQPGTTSDPNGNVLASVAGLYSTEDADTALKVVTDNGMLSPAGQGMPFSIQQPFSVLNYIICTEGIYPSRP